MLPSSKCDVKKNNSSHGVIYPLKSQSVIGIICGNKVAFDIELFIIENRIFRYK